MKPARLHQHWRKELASRVAAAGKLLHKRHPLSAKEVHDLRVALRRARLLASVGCHSIGKSKTKSFRDRAHALLDLLSPIRDCDVALHWLNKTGSPVEVVAELQARRASLWHAVKHRIRSARSKLEIRAKSDHHKKLADRLERKMANAVNRCQATVENQRQFSVAELHALRRVLRRWRYLYELQLKNRKQRHDPALKLLIKVQDSLGALQNTEAILEQLKPLGRTKALHEVRAKLKRSYDRLHREALHQIKLLPYGA